MKNEIKDKPIQSENSEEKNPMEPIIVRQHTTLHDSDLHASDPLHKCHMTMDASFKKVQYAALEAEEVQFLTKIFSIRYIVFGRRIIAKAILSYEIPTDIAISMLEKHFNVVAWTTRKGMKIRIRMDKAQKNELLGTLRAIHKIFY